MPPPPAPPDVHPRRSTFTVSPRSTVTASLSLLPFGVMQRRLHASCVPGTGAVGGANESVAVQFLASSLVAYQFSTRNR
jgi:hypothetical protein